MTIELEEGDRQAILLALAKLSLSRPGWHPAYLSRIAEQLGGRAMYEQFRSYGPDVIKEPETSAACEADLEKMVLWAWVGADELGSGELGLKQARTPAGMIPLVACKEGKIDKPEIAGQLQSQATVFRKVIRLVRFRYQAVVETLNP